MDRKAPSEVDQSREQSPEPTDGRGSSYGGNGSQRMGGGGGGSRGVGMAQTAAPSTQLHSTSRAGYGRSGGPSYGAMPQPPQHGGTPGHRPREGGSSPIGEWGVPYVQGGQHGAMPYMQGGQRGAMAYVQGGQRGAVAYVQGGQRGAMPYVQGGQRGAMPYAQGGQRGAMQSGYGGLTTQTSSGRMPQLDGRGRPSPQGGRGRSHQQGSVSRPPMQTGPDGSPVQPQRRSAGSPMQRGHGGSMMRSVQGGPPLQGGHEGMLIQSPGRAPPQGPRPGGGMVHQGRRGGAPPQPRGQVPQQSGSRGGYSGGYVGRGDAGTVPELQQARPTPLPVKPQEAVAVLDLSHGLQKLHIEASESSCREIQVALPSNKSVRFPLRPGKGTAGVKCKVKANHFFAQLPDKDFHQYDVTITPEVTSRGTTRALMEQLIKAYKKKELAGRLPAYDGRKSLYTAGPLPFTSKEFRITLIDEDDGSGCPRREREYKISIKLASRADLHHLELFLQGKHADAPQEALQVLDIVLREMPISQYIPVGRSFYSPYLGNKVNLGEGLESWRGFYQSIRPTQMGLSLNIDMSSTAFIEPKPVLEFVAELLSCDQQPGSHPRDITSRPLSDADRIKIKKALRGVKIEVTHRGSIRRKYRISGLTSQATWELTFPIERGNMKSVVEYFKEAHHYTIQHTLWPCLQVGNQQRPNYLPMEVCKIVQGQRYTKRLNERQITKLLQQTCQRPKARENDIIETVGKNDYANDPYANEFGIRISQKLAVVEARVLVPPKLKYHPKSAKVECHPKQGQWNMVNRKVIDPGKVRKWKCLNFSVVDTTIAKLFCSQLIRMCRSCGMEFYLPPDLEHYPVTHAPPNEVETVLARIEVDLDLLIAILPDSNGSLYGILKRTCETQLGIVSQCCLRKHVLRMTTQYLANVALKINVKVGGRNTVLEKAVNKDIPIVSDGHTIIFGADVTHPHPGEDSSPSIAAVVASQDWPDITKYYGLVCAQAHRQELIQDLFTYDDPVKEEKPGGMIKELLESFIRENNNRPARIIFYRDGVSEGQFYQVLLHELDAIRKACATIAPDYQPTVTFIVVQKRHHTRLFANDHDNLDSMVKSGNVLPG